MGNCAVHDVGMSPADSLCTCPKEKCRHEFEITCTFTFIEDRGDWMVDIKIRCQVCDTPFMFKGIPAGMSFNAPRVSIDAMELRAPIKPYDNTLAAKATFDLSRSDS